MFSSSIETVLPSGRGRRDYDLFVMRANGRGQRLVVDGPDQGLDHPGPWAEVSAPTWQPLPR